MSALFNPPKAPTPPPPPPNPPQMASGAVKDAATAARAAAAAAAGSGLDNTIGPGGAQGSPTPSTSAGKTLLGQ